MLYHYNGLNNISNNDVEVNKKQAWKSLKIKMRAKVESSTKID